VEIVSRVGVVGAGYVGLTTAACLAHLGHDVVCGDVDVEKVARLSRGDVPILENGLPELVAAGLRRGRLSFVLGAGAATSGQEFVFLCVPTPQRPDSSADLSFVEEALRELAPVLRPDAVVVAKSTMPPGSSRHVRQVLAAIADCPPSVGVVSNPEFLREGSAVHDFLHPDRIVVGSDEPETAVRVSALYKGIQAPLLVTDCASAEMIKYASNTFLATKISFVNAIANLCEAFDADVRSVTLGMGYDHRIGFDFLSPGPGYGGPCLPKDTAALIRAAEEVDYDFSLLRGVTKVNETQHARVVEKVEAVTGGVDGVRIAVWGLTFKADTDDLRGSPALEVVRRLLAAGALIAAFDPAAGEEAGSLLGAREINIREVTIPDSEVVLVGERAMATAPAAAPLRVPPERFFATRDAYEACRDAAVLVVLTEWDEFRWLDFERVQRLMSVPSVVDARNILDPAALRRIGFSYQGIGR
jgi:UDPglucose 6-dehydrogenase